MKALGLAVLLVLVAGCSSQSATIHATPAAIRSSVTTAPRRAPARGPRAASTGSAAVHHYLYVFDDGAMAVYDIDHADRLVQQVALPSQTSIRGVVASPVTHTLYVSNGGDSASYTGSLTAIDLLTDHVMWTRSYPHGVDSMAVNAAGTRIFMPDGELSGDGLWWVLNADDGSPLSEIHAGIDPHNTIVGPSGRIYLGAVHTPYLEVADPGTGQVAARIGPLRGGVRPFTINGRETLAFTTATGFLGFQVSSITTARVLYTERFGRRFAYDPARFAPTAPSHGISLSPDERRLWVIDGPNSYVHVFDVSRLPRHAPRELASIRLAHPLTGTQAGCGFDCARDGWLLTSRSGCQVFVGDSGDVIDARRMRIVRYLPALRQTRQFLEIDWSRGVPVATTSRTGLGYVIPGRPPARQGCR